ncbi:MAG: ATP-binding protein, partial [Lawsonibacter sp.]
VKKEKLDLTGLAGEVLREEEMIHPQRAFLPRWGEEPVTVYADPGLMKQVMRILMDNSIKYSPESGRIYLRVSQGQGHARITVQDEGMGIPPDALPHIFERFYRTDRSRDRKTGGTGLGLSIAKWIVDRHGGWFEVVSRPDVGTRITFVLPLAPGEAPKA